MSDIHRLHEFALDASDEPLYARISTAVADLGRRPARQAILAGLVTCGGTVVREPNQILTHRCKVIVDLRKGIDTVRKAQRQGAAGGTRAMFTILHEDPQLLVIDKAAGIASAPTRGEDHDHVIQHIRTDQRKRGRSGFIGQIHRLDRETSGCLCFALTREAQGLLSAQFAGGAAQRIYRCIVHGRPSKTEGTLRSNLGRGDDNRRASVSDGAAGKEAITHWKVLREHRLGSELEVRLETGRTHQIRIHLAEMGCPVLGDRVYGQNILHRAVRAPRLMLHAWQLALDHPRNGQRITVTCELPPEFAEVAALLDTPPVVKPRTDAIPADNAKPAKRVATPAKRSDRPARRPRT